MPARWTFRTMEAIGFVLPSVLAHVLTNPWIAHVLYTGYFVAHVWGAPARYQRWKARFSYQTRVGNAP